jgi:hypothetical protein
MGPPVPPAVDNQQPSSDRACIERLHRLDVRISLRPTVQQGECGIAEPVMLDGLDGGPTLQPTPMLSCSAAEMLARWLREAVLPETVASTGEKVARLSVAGSYECRSRNRVEGAPMSEHALGNALDLAGVELTSGRVLSVAPGSSAPAAEIDWAKSVRRSACSYFSTVLGPGADPEHHDHLHLDVKARSNGYRICE